MQLACANILQRASLRRPFVLPLFIILKKEHPFPGGGTVARHGRPICLETGSAPYVFSIYLYIKQPVVENLAGKRNPI